MTFTEHDMTTMHADLAAICERVHKLILIRGITAPHRLDQMHHLRLLEKFAVWKINNGIDMSEALADRQCKTLGRVYLVDDPEHFGLKVYYFRPRRPPSPQEFTENMRREVNQLRQDTLPPQPPQQQPCSVSRVVMVKDTVKPEKDD